MSSAEREGKGKARAIPVADSAASSSTSPLDAQRSIPISPPGGRDPPPDPHLSVPPPRVHRRTPPPAPLAFPPPAPTMPAAPTVPAAPLVPADLLPLLHCPQCAPPAPLAAPTTLQCGHSVCSDHVALPAPQPAPAPASPPARPAPPALPACPLPTCLPTAPSSTLRPNIPPESTVTYFPLPVHGQSPAPTAPAPAPPRVADVRVDVTLSKVVALVHRARLWPDEDGEFLPVRDGSDDSDDDGPERAEHAPHAPRASGPQPQASSSAPSGRRRRRHGSRRPHKRQRTDPPAAAAAMPAATGRFEKELLQELTCEICFMLFYQPVTTPCQHVCARCV